MTTSKKDSRGPVRRYQQYCPVARSLNVLGERWTLLIVRDLMMGPHRYGDLRDALPGIATDLLTDRLRTLEQAGYVRRRELPRPARVTVYELTDSGQQLASVVLALARVGLPQLGVPAAGEDIDVDALVLLLRASFRADAAGETGARYQLDLDGEQFGVEVESGWAQTSRGVAANADLSITTTPRTLAELLSGATDADRALSDGDVQIDGSQEALETFVASFKYSGAPGQPV